MITRDPLDGVPGTPTEANPYHYADNDPINNTDPTGMRPGDGTFGRGGSSGGGFAGRGFVPMGIGFCNDGFPGWCNDEPQAGFDPGYDRVPTPWLPLPLPMPSWLPDEGWGCAVAVIVAGNSVGPNAGEVVAGCAVALDWKLRLDDPTYRSRFTSDPGERNAERHFVWAAALSYNAGAAGAFAAAEIHERYGHCSSPVQTECDHDRDVDERNNEWGVGYGLHRRYDFGLAFHADNERMFDDFLREARRLIANRVLDTSGACQHADNAVFPGEC